MTASAKYLWVLLGVAFVLLGLILGLNLLLGARALGGPEVTRMASEWQQQSRGVTYAPPITRTRPFKSLRLAGRIRDINAIVLGSSTNMGITAAMFPPPLQAYNFTSTANPTYSLVGEAEYFLEHHGDHLRFMLIGLDWSIGMIYHSVPVAAADLSPQTALSAESHPPVALHRRIADALSYPKVQGLLQALRADLRAADPVDAFRRTFFDIASAPYRCEDGDTARDFDVVNRGICRGFRYDGSWTYGGDRRLTPARAAVLAQAAAAPSSKFSKFLCETGGEPHAEYLARFGKAAREFAAKGGRMVFLMPPIIPGMETAMGRHEPNRVCLERTKTVIGAWARQYGVTVIDAGRSERYGCEARDFSDEHHAYPQCLGRALASYFRAEGEGRVKPGLFQP